ncbi:unnamed protein product [Arctogadus glacialis]
MQLLWDLRKSFKCAVLVDPTLESSLIASAVFNLYTADESHNHRTVLLLVQNGNVHTLQKSFLAELSERKIDSVKPVVVILNCVRIAHINAGHSAGVKLSDTLTDNERKKFDDKKEWLNSQYTKENGIIPTEFHGFNIMQSNFSKDYVKRACDVFNPTDCRPSVPNRGLEFTACLCLLNSYVPGSVMLESHCEKCLSSFEKEMGPFRHLMVSFNPNGSGGQKIQERARFINMLMSYSQESFEEEDPDYVLKDARTCYKDYTGDALPEGLGKGPTEDQLRFLHENWQNDTQEPRLNLKMRVEKLKSSFHEKYFRSRYLLPRLYLETSDGTKVRVGGVVRCYKVYTTVGDEEIQLDVDPAKQLALWKSGAVTFELGFTIRGPTAYDIQFQD